jgi:hypothetical protein
MHRLLFIVLSISLALASRPANAGDDTADGIPRAREAIERPEDIKRPFLYSADPTAPASGHVLANIGVGYASIDRGAARPFAADLTHAGAVMSAGAELGIARYFTLQAEGLLAGRGGDAPLAAGVMAGMGFHLAEQKLPIDLALTGGYLRELGGSNGVWARAALARDFGRARIIMTALGEHVFDPKRDKLDLLVTAGASFAVVDSLRLGAEYVAQDLEGAWEHDEPDGGIRHFIGPNASLDLASHRVRIGLGPAFGLSPGSPRLLGRLAAMYLF